MPSKRSKADVALITGSGCAYLPQRQHFRENLERYGRQRSANRKSRPPQRDGVNEGPDPRETKDRPMKPNSVFRKCHFSTLTILYKESEYYKWIGCKRIQL